MKTLDFINEMANKAFRKPRLIEVAIVDPANPDQYIKTNYHPLVWAKLSKAYKKGFDIIQIREVY